MKSDVSKSVKKPYSAPRSTRNDVEWDIEPLAYDCNTWGFNVRYCLSQAKSDTTYYTFPETFPTKQSMMDCALKVAPQYLLANLAIILSALNS